ncbi:MAG: hypothetical protein M1821_002013 [Bathelium mastoideum]|nr:MAG: hypothetical protein M1821_002013 [Bathelium mastoideum]
MSDSKHLQPKTVATLANRLPSPSSFAKDSSIAETRPTLLLPPMSGNGYQCKDSCKDDYQDDHENDYFDDHYDDCDDDYGDDYDDDCEDKGEDGYRGDYGDKDDSDTGIENAPSLCSVEVSEQTLRAWQETCEDNTEAWEEANKPPIEMDPELRAHQYSRLRLWLASLQPPMQQQDPRASTDHASYIANHNAMPQQEFQIRPSQQTRQSGTAQHLPTPPITRSSIAAPASEAAPAEPQARWFPSSISESIVAIAELAISAIALFGVYLVLYKAYERVGSLDVNNMEPVGFPQALRDLKDHIVVLIFFAAVLIYLKVLQGFF